MDDNFSSEVRDIITSSKQIALQYDNDFIDTSHILLAIINQGKSNVFNEFNIDGNKIKKEILAKLLLDSKIVSDENIDFKKSLRLTIGAETALKTSFLEAKLYGDDSINTYHLLLCLLRNENDEATKTLVKGGVNYDKVKMFYKEVKLNNDFEPPSVKVKNYDKVHLLHKSLSYKLEGEVMVVDNVITDVERLNVLNRISKSKVEIIKIDNITEEEAYAISNYINIIHLEIINSPLDDLIPLEEIIRSHKKLRKLKIEDCGLENIIFLAEFTGLIELSLKENLIRDSTPLKNLINIKHLDISWNYINDFSFLDIIIKNSPKVIFNDNKVEKISERVLLYLLEDNYKFNIENIRNLKTISVDSQNYEIAAELRDYEIKVDLNKELSIAELESLRKIYIKYFFKNLPIKSPPIEIIKEGVSDVKAYFHQIDKDKKESYLFEGKLLIIGEGGVGKTSFVKKMINSKSNLPVSSETTFNIDINKIEFKMQNDLSDKMYINAWDFGGQKIYRGTHQLFFSDKCLYVLVDDNREEKTDFSYWINTIHQLAGKDCSLVIVLNQKHGRKGSSFDEVGYKSQFGDIIKDVIEVDLKKDISEIDILRDIIKLRFRSLPLIGNPLPYSWVKIREELKGIHENYISFDSFLEICKRNNVKDFKIIDTICSYFNNIGVFTHYSDDVILRERIYLNSNWLVETLYKVLDNEIINENKGRISFEEVNEIWVDEGLHLEIERFCSLMNKFGLMYQIQESNNFVVPEKLPKQKPYDNWEYTNESNLKFKYEFEKYNPKGIMSKIIVGLNKYIKNQDLVWHKGMNIEYDDTFAEIIETYGMKNSFEIRISGDNKNVLLAIVIEKFDEILSVYKNLIYNKLVQCNCVKCVNDKDPHFFKYSALIRRREKSVLHIDCEKDFEKVNVNSLLKGIEKKNFELKTIEIFLASSLELKKDRTELEVFINRENKKLIKKNIFLSLNIWEDFVDSISQTRLQDEYNKVAVKSDIFISLFATKVGKYTLEEFTVSYKSFKENKTPMHIYTFFKDVRTGISSINRDDFNSLNDFKERLVDLGHFSTSYKDENDLIKQIKLQFDKILDSI
jgi:internalin A